MNDLTHDKRNGGCLSPVLETKIVVLEIFLKCRGETFAENYFQFKLLPCKRPNKLGLTQSPIACISEATLSPTAHQLQRVHKCRRGACLNLLKRCPREQFSQSQLPIHKSKHRQIGNNYINRPFGC